MKLVVKYKCWVIDIQYRTCVKCKGYTFILIRRMKKELAYCPACLEEMGCYSNRRYVCSVEGCDSNPTHLTAMDSECEVALLLCTRHLRKLKSRMKFIFSLPIWLTDDEDILSSKGGVVLQRDFSFYANSMGTWWLIPNDCWTFTLRYHNVLS